MEALQIIAGIAGIVFLIFIESKTHLFRTLWKIFMG